MVIVAALTVGAGLALVVVSLLVRAREADDNLARFLDFYNEDEAADTSRGTGTDDDGVRAVMLEAGVGIAQRALEGLSLMDRVSGALDKARLPLRPGEFVLATAGAAIGSGLFTTFLTGQLLVGVIVGALIVFAAWRLVLLKATRRRKAFEEQFPEAVSLIASSLQAGHTFLRAIQMMVEESEPPLSEEFERVVAETGLGDPLVDALERMATRLGVKDLAWVVQAIRIQQEVGGRLAELLFTLADFMRAREDIRREVRVLTAEGRASAYVMGGLPVFTFLAIQSAAPNYMKPMLHGGGLVALGGAAGMVAFGVFVIMRMVKVEV